MAATYSSSSGFRSQPVRADSRFDRRLAEILAHATDVFYEKGYAGASMRDLSRATGMSLAGLYYYFESKEKLLYLVQKHTFATVLQNLRQKLEGVNDPEQRIRIFVRNHLEYFLGNQRGMKVLSHETAALKDDHAVELLAIRRQYYRQLRDLSDEARRQRGIQAGSSRVAVLSLFGMMNWIYTWYRPEKDGNPDQLASEMSDIYLHGLLAATPKTGNGNSGSSQSSAPKRGKGASSKL
jgi:AcrR family transcriptional regulator